MHIDDLIEKLQRIKNELQDADMYFTVDIDDFSYEVDFEEFYADAENNNVEMKLVYKAQKARNNYVRAES